MFKDGVLKGKRILVTGGGTGLGREMTEDYLRLGAAEADSGFLFRASRASRNQLAGYEADAGGPRFGALRDAAGDRGSLAQAKNEIWRTLADPLGWNHVVVTARGDRVAIEVNGDLAVDLVDPKGPKSGLLGFRLEPGARNDLRLRHVRIRE